MRLKKPYLKEQLSTLRNSITEHEKNYRAVSERNEALRVLNQKLEKDHTSIKSKYEILEKETIALRSLVNSSLRTMVNKFPSFASGNISQQG